MVTCVSLSAILGFVTWAILKYHHHHHHQDHFQESSSWSRWQLTRPEEANEEFAAWKLWVGNNCTWLYIGSQVIKFTIVRTLKVLHQAAWAVFVVSLFFSKFGDVKLGLEGSTPEYNNASWWLSYGGIILKLNNIVKSFSSLTYIMYSVYNFKAWHIHYINRWKHLKHILCERFDSWPASQCFLFVDVEKWSS